MEFVHGVFNAADMNGGNACFYHHPVSLEETDAPERLASLIERSRATGHPFRTFEDVEELGRMVREDLLAMIDREWPGEDSPDELEIEEGRGDEESEFCLARTVPILITHEPVP